MLEARPSELLNVDRAIERLLALASSVTEVETVALPEAVGRISAEEVLAPCDLPPFDASAMDGYAVVRGGREQHPRETVSRDRREPGRSSGHLPRNRRRRGADSSPAPSCQPTRTRCCCRKMPRPAEGSCRLPSRCVPGSMCVVAATTIATGATLCAPHTKLSAYHATWLAACGIASVRVKRRVRVAVASTGDELTAPGQQLGMGQIYDSNRFALSTLLGQKACDIVDLGCLADDREAVREALANAARHADLIVTSGGVSVGSADFVKDVIAELGEVEFWRIAMKPGKPLTVGRIGQALVIGLPGNPVSTIVTYLLFVAPAIDKTAGAKPPEPLILRAQLERPVRHTLGRREYMRGDLRTSDGELLVHTTGDQSSNRLSTFANANCLVIIDENVSDMAAGETVGVIPLQDETAHLLCK